MDLKEILAKYIQKDVLTEDVQTELETLFEASVSKKMSTLLEAKEKALEEKFSNELADFKGNLVETMNDYIELATEDFMTENKIELESAIKVKMADSVVTNLVKTLKENFVEIPENETNVVKDLSIEVQNLKGKLDESINDKRDSEKQMLEYEKANTFTKLSSDLTESEKEKAMNLLEDVDVDSIETFEKKAKVIIENISVKNLKEEKILEEDLNLQNEDLDKDLQKEKSEIDMYLGYV